ncbi:MAG: DUF2332 domain-containing protein [Actinocatenispora sp.]
MSSVSAMARHFAFVANGGFASSPLYTRLCAIVADDERLLDIAAHGRPGQQPSNLLFAAVHFLLLGDSDLAGGRALAGGSNVTGASDSDLAGRNGPAGDAAPPALAAWYPSLAGTRRPDDPELAGAFADFCLTRRSEIVGLVRHRLVQTNVVKRSALLRLGLSALAPELAGRPVTFLEVGASSGIHLAFDRYRCRIGDRTFGPEHSPVVIDTEWRSPLPVPTGTVRIVDRLGVDLNPVDMTDPVERRWLRALVWPENHAQAELLAAAALLVAESPARIVPGDAATVLARLDAELRTDMPLVVWHAATRAHVAADRRPAFDAAIAVLGRRRPLWTLSLETPDDDVDAWYARYGMCYALQLRAGTGDPRRLAAAHGHGDWVEPVDWPRASLDGQPAR